MNNTAWALLERITQLFFGFVPFIFLARIFDKESVALYSILTVLLFNFWSLSSFNSRTIFIKYDQLYGKYFERKWLLPFLINKIFYSIIFGIMLLTYIYSLGYLSGIIIFIFIFYLLNFFEPILWGVESRYQQEKIFYSRLVVGFIFFFIKMYVIVQNKSIDILLLVLAVELLSFHLVICFVSRKRMVEVYRNAKIVSFNSKNWLFFTKKIFPLFISNLLVIIYVRTDQVMLASFSTSNDLANYSVVLKLIEPLAIIPSAICATALPFIFSKLSSSSNVKNIIYGYCSLLFYISIVITVPLFLFGNLLVTFLFGEAYLDSGLLMMIMSITIPFSFFSIFNGMLLVVYNQQALAPARSLLGVLINILLNSMLIPFWGAIGAAISTVLTLMIGGVFVYYIVPSTRKIAVSNFVAPFHIKMIKNIKL